MTPEEDEVDPIMLEMVHKVFEEVATIIIENLAEKVANEDEPEMIPMTAEEEELFEIEMAKEIEEEVLTLHSVEMARWNALNKVVEDELMKPESEEQSNENDAQNSTPLSVAPVEHPRQDPNPLAIIPVLPNASEQQEKA